MASALLEVRDERYYLNTDKTFEDYCERRWGFTRSRAYEFIEAASVAKTIGLEGDRAVNLLRGAVLSESHLAELAKAPESKQKAAVRLAVKDAPKDANGHPALTAKIVRAAVKKIVDPKPESKPESPVRSKITAPPEPEEPKDENGTPLPNNAKLREAFEQGAIFDDLMNRLSQIKSVATKITDEGAFQFNRQQFEAHIKNARAELKFGRPYAVCPYCKATPQKIKCDACKGKGWVAYLTYNGAPSEMKVAG